jgi:serpin B
MRTRALVATLLIAMSTSLAHAAPSGLDFANRLYGDLARSPGNLFFSPESIRLCLGLAYAGARGATAAQMRTTLGYTDVAAEGAQVAAQLARWDKLARPDLPPAATQTSDPSMQKYWEEELERRTTELFIANRLWTQVGQPLRADYLAFLKKDYRADAVSVDFKKSVETVRIAINKWVSDRTKKKIPSLIAPNMLTPDTRTVLVNAIYFKASWADAFEPGFTKTGPFFIAAAGASGVARSVNVPLMRKGEHFGYAKVDGAQLVELPYGDEQLAMVIVVPTARDGLHAVEKQLPAQLAAWLARLNGTLVDLTLPRFKLSGSFSLADSLKRIGMPLPFTFPGADFSGIDGTKLLYLSEVVHQAVVSVDEKGTEAAAATAASMKAGGAPQEPIPVRADHPFLFLIRDRGTGAILFMGRVVDPTHA